MTVIISKFLLKMLAHFFIQLVAPRTFWRCSLEMLNTHCQWPLIPHVMYVVCSVRIIIYVYLANIAPDRFMA